MKVVTDLKIFTIMKHTGICIASLLGGMVLGSALAMLFTPQSGPELRQSIRDLVDKEIDKVKSEVDKVRCRCDEKID